MRQQTHTRRIRIGRTSARFLLVALVSVAAPYGVFGATGQISTVAGASVAGFSGDGGMATAARFDFPYALAVDSSGNFYVADRNNHRIRKVDTAGKITTVAGNGVSGFSGDGGPATSAAVRDPRGVTVDGAGNLYIATGARIRRVDTAGIITTIVGTGAFGFGGDGGPALSAVINSPSAIALDSAGNIFFIDVGNGRIRKVDTAGTITTVAGNGTFGDGGDGGPAVNAQLKGMEGLTVDGAGNVLIGLQNKIRKVDTTGTISTLVGTGVQGFSGDGGPATSAQVGGVVGVAMDGAGNVFFADSPNHRIRKVDPAGTITTIAGTGVIGQFGDGGPATSARLAHPRGVALDGSGNLLIVDPNRIRKVELAAPAPCRYTLDPRRKVVRAEGGVYGAMMIPSDAACTWRARSADAWIRVLEPRGVLAGIGNVVYKVRANANSSARTGSIRVGPLTHVVRQPGATAVTPPGAPDKLRARRLSKTAVELTWKDVAGETGYELRRRGRVYRAARERFVLPANTTRFEDRGLDRGKRYCYTLRAIGPAGRSQTSRVCIKTPR